MLNEEQINTLVEEYWNNPLGIENLSDGYDKYFMEGINRDGSASVEEWVISEEPVTLPKSEILDLLTFKEIADFRKWRSGEQSDYAIAANELGKNFTTPDVTRPKFRQMVQLLRKQGIIKTDETAQSILRLGERLKSRSEELIGRKITLEEAKQVIDRG